MSSSKAYKLEDEVYAQNFEVTVHIGTLSLDTKIQMTLLKTDSFLSGIPFYSTAKIADFNTPIMKNFLKYSDDHSFYLPYNTITESCDFTCNMMDSKELYSKIKCPLNNTNGTSMMTMIFKKIGNDYNSVQKVLLIKQIIDNGKTSRKNYVSSQFMQINMAVYGVNEADKRMKSISQSDAEIKAAKLASIKSLRLSIETYTTQLLALKAKKITLSNDLQNIKTKNSELDANKKTKIATKISLIVTIATLESKITAKDLIAELEKKNVKNMDLLKYWLDGSVYHRIISESEMTGLVGKASKPHFDKEVTNFFFPQ
jgi:hypothetical protein